jgi:hypothetical protein
MEDEHDGTEPPEDSEPSLGWARHDKQGCAARLGRSVRYDLEEGAASVRKSRLASKTSGKTLRGVRSADLALYRNPAQPVDRRNHYSDAALRLAPMGQVLFSKRWPRFDGAICVCAEYERQLGGGSPLSSLMTAKD